MPSDPRETERQSYPERVRKAAEERGRLEGDGDDLATAESISKSIAAQRQGFFPPSGQNAQPVELNVTEPGGMRTGLAKAMRQATSDPVQEYLDEAAWGEDFETPIEKGTGISPARALTIEMGKLVQAFEDAEGRPPTGADESFTKAMAELISRRTGIR